VVNIEVAQRDSADVREDPGRPLVSVDERIVSRIIQTPPRLGACKHRTIRIKAPPETRPQAIDSSDSASSDRQQISTELPACSQLLIAPVELRGRDQALWSLAASSRTVWQAHVKTARAWRAGHERVAAAAATPTVGVHLDAGGLEL